MGWWWLCVLSFVLDVLISTTQPVAVAFVAFYYPLLRVGAFKELWRESGFQAPLFITLEQVTWAKARHALEVAAAAETLICFCNADN
jgi:hypothetical protein